MFLAERVNAMLILIAQNIILLAYKFGGFKILVFEIRVLGLTPCLAKSYTVLLLVAQCDIAMN